jgi:hypothetical protein
VTFARNIEYARNCFDDAMSKNEAPYASHLFLAETKLIGEEFERQKGLQLAFMWMQDAGYVVVYADHGLSVGMIDGISMALHYDKNVFFRMKLTGTWAQTQQDLLSKLPSRASLGVSRYNIELLPEGDHSLLCLRAR